MRLKNETEMILLFIGKHIVRPALPYITILTAISIWSFNLANIVEADPNHKHPYFVNFITGFFIIGGVFYLIPIGLGYFLKEIYHDIRIQLLNKWNTFQYHELEKRKDTSYKLKRL
jgi:hypothetical protein